MNKKIVSVFAALCLAAGLLAGCGGGGETQALREAGVLHACFVKAKDRYTFEQNGAVTGVEMQIAQNLAKSLGAQLEYDLAEDNNSFFEKMSSGEYDIGFGRTPNTDIRLSGLAVSSSYGRGGLFLITRKNNYMDSLSMMELGIIGVSTQADSLYDEVEGTDGFQKKEFDTLDELRDAVAQGDITAGLTTEREALSIISNGGVQAQELINTPMESYVAVLPTGTKLKSAADGAVNDYYLNLIGYFGQEEGEEQNQQ